MCQPREYCPARPLALAACEQNDCYCSIAAVRPLELSFLLSLTFYIGKLQKSSTKCELERFFQRYALLSAALRADTQTQCPLRRRLADTVCAAPDGKRAAFTTGALRPSFPFLR